jgi:hypothetical protein
MSVGQSSYGEQWDWWLALPGVEAAATSARATVDRLLTHRVLRQGAAAVAAEVSLRCARASASLDPSGAGADERVLAGAVRAQAELPALVRVWGSSPRQALARLHLLAAAGIAPHDEVGRPAGGGGAQAVGRAVGLASAAGRAPAVVVAAVVHAELTSAFATAGGVVARAVARLVLAERGLDPSLLVAVDVGHLEQGGYEAALAAYRTGDAGGAEAWLLHAAAAVEAGATESLAICEAMARG